METRNKKRQKRKIKIVLGAVVPTVIRVEKSRELLIGKMIDDSQIRN